jgi:hypothetical protein
MIDDHHLESRRITVQVHGSAQCYVQQALVLALQIRPDKVQRHSVGRFPPACQRVPHPEHRIVGSIGRGNEEDKRFAKTGFCLPLPTRNLVCEFYQGTGVLIEGQRQMFIFENNMLGTDRI